MNKRQLHWVQSTLLSLLLVTGNTFADTGSSETLVSIEKLNGNLHTLVTSDEQERVTLHLIEGKGGLLLVDTGFGGHVTTKMKVLAKKLNKEIKAVLVSHAHPDHTGGLAEWGDIPIFTTQNVKKSINSGVFPVPANAASIQVLKPGRNRLAGLVLDIEEIADTEADFHMLVHLPELDTSVIQDMAYNNVYFFPGVDRKRWLTTLEGLQTRAYETLLMGHGYPNTKGHLSTAIDYLKRYETLLKQSKNPEELVEKLKIAYPNYMGGDVILDLQKFAFPKAK